MFQNQSFLFQNECSFVSLRDVERAMEVIMWFYSNSELIDEVIKKGNSRNERRPKKSKGNQMNAVRLVITLRLLSTYILFF